GRPRGPHHPGLRHIHYQPPPLPGRPPRRRRARLPRPPRRVPPRRPASEHLRAHHPAPPADADTSHRPHRASAARRSRTRHDRGPHVVLGRLRLPVHRRRPHRALRTRSRRSPRRHPMGHPHRHHTHHHRPH